MKLIVGNFKMNLDHNEINEYIDYFKDKKYQNVVFAPSSIYLMSFIKNGFTVAAQDVSFAKLGAYTGDLSACQLKSIGVDYTIIGHSERRKYYDDDKYVNKKLEQLLAEGIIPILCIGETKEERDKNITFEILTKEIDNSFQNIDKDKLKSVIIAYEPIWSIGTGVIPTNEDINKVINFIKNYIYNNYLLKLEVLYGGSVNNSNIVELEKNKTIDGYLIGSCSINIDEFDKLIKTIG